MQTLSKEYIKQSKETGERMLPIIQFTMNITTINRIYKPLTATDNGMQYYFIVLYIIAVICGLCALLRGLSASKRIDK